MAALDLLTKARLYLGTPYADLDCSHFVHRAFEDAGMAYPYLTTAEFAFKSGKYFVEVFTPQSGDVVLYSGHMGIYDPNGCKMVLNDQTCRRLGNNAPVLNSQSGNNKGVTFGRNNFYAGSPRYFRWKG